MTALRKAFIAAVVKSLLRGKSLLQAILAYWTSPKGRDASRKIERPKGASPMPHRTIQDFLKEAEELLLTPTSNDALLALSAGLKAQFLARLEDSMACMLPEYSHQLPSGRECGQYLALDVGGSTLRVAVVELGDSSAAGEKSKIVSMSSYKIDQTVKALEGMAFFDWMSERILDTISKNPKNESHSATNPLPMALAWSFPVE
jgi:hexokinase